MNVGDVYRYSHSRHWWTVVVASAADGRLLVVNFTSNKRWQDQSCVLSPGEHPVIERESVVYYARAKLETDAALERLLASGRIHLHDQLLDAAAVTRIVRGALRSERIPLALVEFLQQQGFESGDP